MNRGSEGSRDPASLGRYGSSGREEAQGQEQHSSGHGKYWRFGLMILTSTIVMYALMYETAYRWSHIEYSESRVYMALFMGSAMAVIMIGYMWGMFRSQKANIAIVVFALVVFGSAVALDRTQVAVDDSSFMRSMIPHHSMAILRSEETSFADVRVRELAQEIIEAQVREINEMEWLLEDISQNGVAETQEEAEARPVPEFSGEQ